MLRGLPFRSIWVWLLLGVLPLGQLLASESFTWAVYGENQSGFGDPNIHKKLLEQIETENPAILLHTGNMVGEGDRKYQWTQFFTQGGKVLKKIPFRPAVGSLDRSKRETYSKFFLKKGEKTYFSLHLGPVNIIALDTTRNFAPDSPQYRFLASTLQGLPASSPIVVYFNHPPFSGSRLGGDEKVVEYLVPLFEQYGVDLVLAGQDRAYQRIGPVNGVLYIVTGGGGAPLFPVEPDPIIASYKTLYHYLVFNVEGGKILGSMKDVRGVTEDSFEIPYDRDPVPLGQRQPLPELKRSTRYYKR